MSLPNWTPEQVKQFRVGLLFGIVSGLVLVTIIVTIYLSQRGGH